MTNGLKTRDLIMCAFFAALSAVLSQIQIPIGPVPVNLAFISMYLAGGLLGPWKGLASQGAFVLMGAAGLPVFTGFTGGLGIILGPTGGFIFGYLALTFTTGLLVRKMGRSNKALALAVAAGWIVCYIPGVLWFMNVMNMGFLESLPLCALPFIPGDALKMVCSAALIKRLYPVLNSNSYA